MGSPVSLCSCGRPVNGVFEKLAHRTAPVKFCLWKRYADDNCSIVERGEVKGLLKHVNGVPCELSICFIVEMKRDRHLLFLDTLLRRSDNGSLDELSTGHMDWYLDFHSHHPSREDWSGACMTKQGTSPSGRATLEGRMPPHQGLEVE